VAALTWPIVTPRGAMLASCTCVDCDVWIKGAFRKCDIGNLHAYCMQWVAAAMPLPQMRRSGSRHVPAADSLMVPTLCGAPPKSARLVSVESLRRAASTVRFQCMHCRTMMCS